MLRVNSNFDEQKLDGKGHAVPDSADEDLYVASGPDMGKITTKDLHHGFFGIRPGAFSVDAAAGAEVVIRKLPNIDPDTNQPESGEVRLQVTQDLGVPGEYSWAIELDNLQADGTATTADLGPLLYAADATDAGTDYWLEGITPGPITLEFEFKKGNTDIKYQQHFLVCTEQSKAEWQREVARQILLESGGTINIGAFIPTNEFVDNVPFIKSVYNFYQELYDLSDDDFLWPGMAKLAGAPVFAALNDVQWARNHALIGDIVAALTGVDVTTHAQEFQTQLMTGNKSIYDDLAWQHRAYIASGVGALKYVVATNQAAASLDVWKQLDEGIRQQDADEIAQASEALLRREQEQIVQSMYERIEQIKIEMGSNLGIPFSTSTPVSYNALMSTLAQNPMPNGLFFVAYNAAFGRYVANIGDFDDRWFWIDGDQNEGMFQIWAGTSATKGLSQPARESYADIPLSQRAVAFANPLIKALGWLLP